MDIDLSLNEYGVDTKELASITAMNILSQIGLKVAPRDVMIENFDLFHSKIPEIIRNTKFTVNGYTPNENIAEVENLTENNELSETDLIIQLFYSQPEYHNLEEPYMIQEMTKDGRFQYSNGKTSEYNHSLIDYIYKNLLEYYSSHYKLEEVLMDINNNHTSISLYVLSRILASIEDGVYNRFGFSCIGYDDNKLIQKVVDEIQGIENSLQYDTAPLNIIVSNMDVKYGVSEDKTRAILTLLLQKGLIYQPQAGHYKTI